MPERIEALRSALPEIGVRPAAALRDAIRRGYGLPHLRHDVMAGLVVGIVALPLSMALAIASGVAPQHGLYTAIVAGAVTAVLGGSPTQVSGPTAAFVVVLLPISARFGVGGLLLATAMAGLILIGLGLARLGKLIQYIPYPVTAGFTAGIGTVIAVSQLESFFGLTLAHAPERFVERVAALIASAPTLRLPDLAVGAVTLGILLAWSRVTRRIPSPLVALAAAALGAWIAGRVTDGAFTVETIGTRFTYLVDGEVHPGIPPLPPTPILPWHLPGPDGAPLGLSFALLQSLLPSAFAIAMLGAIESLLSAVVADGMTRGKHDPNTELVAQGVGNLVAPFFGGIAATGAIARTATNIRAGGRTPIAGVVHAAFVLLAVLVLAPLLGYLPMAALAALLLVVAWNMAEVRHVRRVLTVGPRSDGVVLLACFGLTVFFDMVVAVAAGVMLAALLFMRRMAELAGATLIEGTHPDLTEPLPKGVVLYEIDGPLFFGAAEKAMSALHGIGGGARVAILDLESVPVMDATGLVNLESTLDRLWHDGVFVILAAVQHQPEEMIDRAGLWTATERLAFRDSVASAVRLARERLTA
jgi:SulP family sulfate permease